MTETIFEESSGNVFADLGLDDADEMFMRGKIGIQVVKLLKERSLKQREISELLGIAQPEVSHLLKGEFQRFSEGKLFMFLKRLDTEITLHIRHQPIPTGRLGNDSNNLYSPLTRSTTTRIFGEVTFCLRTQPDELQVMNFEKSEVR